MLDDLPLIKLLLARLERISADSPLAHRASGVRGALLRCLDDPAPQSIADVRCSVEAALQILTQAATQVRSGRPLLR